MGKLERQIKGKLEEWTAAGLISPEQAAAIRAREPEEKAGLPWGILIFAGFGAVVLGLGVILLFAYNWDKMHKFVKLGLVFGALAAAHGTGLWLRQKERLHGFAEGALLLGTMLFGAGIWLVAQIYHISAHYPNAFFVWAAGALLLAWALPSVPQGLLAAVLLCVWGCTEAGAFSNHLVAAPLLILVGTGWLAWRLRSPTLLTVSVISFTVSAATGFAFNGDCVFTILLTVAVLLGALAWLTRGHAKFPTAAVVFRVTGIVLYFPLLFILTFHKAAEDLLERHSYRWYEPSLAEWLPLIILPIVALALMALAVRRAVVRHELNTAGFRGGLLAPLVIFLMYNAFWWFAMPHADTTSVITALTANTIFIYYTVAGLWVGCRGTRLGLVVSGSLMLAAWVFARFADLFDSLLARGVMFVAMGGALLVVAILYHRQKKKAVAPPADSALATGKEG